MHRRAQRLLLGIGLCLSVVLPGCSREDPGDPAPSRASPSDVPAKITFVELGSVNCIPCRQMQPIMKSVERKYGKQIKVVFHDVWKSPSPGRKYGIRLIPTQVFLDETGNEVMRHEGFLPEAKIDQFLESRGLKIIDNQAAQ